MNDKIKQLIVASTATIPYLGGSISVLIDKNIPSELEKRKNNLIENFEKDIEIIKDQVKPGRLESEEYITILFKVFKNAMEEHDKIKLESFRGILQNSAKMENINDPEIEFFIKLINELTVSHVVLFKLIYENIFMENVFYSSSGVIEKELQSFCLNDLKRVNLIYYVKDSLDNYLKCGESLYKVTDLGERFYSFIELE
jgi:hypothetical protein